MSYQIYNNKMLRTNNKRSILLKLFQKGAMSRKALSGECRLTGAAITIIVKDMLESGHLVENGEKLQQNTQGRKEIILDINYNNFLACNINIESDKIHFSLCSLKEIIREEICLTEDMGSNQLEYLEKNIKKIIAGYNDKLIGIGIGVVGTVDEKYGISLNSYGIFENNCNLKAKMEEIFDIPVYVCNNVRAHAKAIIDTKKNLLYIKHGPGLGLAIVVNGEVIKGFNNIAGEIGHTIVGYDMKKNHNSERCLEDYLSEKNLLCSLKGKRDFSGKLAELYELYGGDSIITELLNERLTMLANAIINAIVLFDPEKVVVAGGFFDCAKTFTQFRKIVDEIQFEMNDKIELLPKNIRIKGMAAARLVFNEEFFNNQ